MNDDITREMVSMSALWKRLAKRLRSQIRQLKMERVALRQLKLIAEENEAGLRAENKRLRKLAEFMVQRAMQIETDCLQGGDVANNLAYGYAVRQIEAYEDVIGEAKRDKLSV